MSNLSTKKNNYKFLKSTTFYVLVSLASIFFILFLFSVIQMGIRYNFFRSELTNEDYLGTLKLVSGDSIEPLILSEIKNKFFESDTIWAIFLKDKKGLEAGYYFSEAIPNVELPKSLWETKYTDVNMNLGYTIMTIIFLFAFVITSFVPLAYWMTILNNKRVEKKKLKLEQKALEKNGN